jgi:hypothetical protein
MKKLLTLPSVIGLFLVTPTARAQISGFCDPRSIPGTVGVSTLRGLVSQQGDLTVDWFENLSDLSAFREEPGIASQDTQDTNIGPAAR